jgi:ribosomal protein L11 methyltransferase
MEKRPVWRSAQRSAFKASLSELRSHGLETGVCRITIRRLPAEDWAESWKKHFRPIRVGRSLLIKPSWIEQKPLSGQKVILLDPGLSFGTGNHPTTLFCLRQLTANRPRVAGPSFLDIGTGSGILAIAAAKLGYRPVHAFDYDPDAVRTASENVSLNGLTGKLRLYRADVTRLPQRPKRRFDFVCANLLADLLISQRDRILSQLNPGGTVVLAGILAKEFAQVQFEYEQKGFRLKESATKGEWTSGAFRRAER